MRGVDMHNTILMEFLKVKRSKILLYVMLAGSIPSLVKFLQHSFAQNGSMYGWEWFAASNREVSVFLILTAVTMATAFVFSMENWYGTVSSIFTTRTSRTQIFISKLLAVSALILLILVTSACSDLIFGWIAFGEGLPAELLNRYVKAVLWLVLSYILVSCIIAAITVITRKFVLSAVIAMGYLMLVFPWHLKGNAFICPFMTPTIIAARIFGTGNYIFTNYYTGTGVDSTAAILSLAVLAAAMSAIGLICYRKQ